MNDEQIVLTLPPTQDAESICFTQSQELLQEKPIIVWGRLCPSKLPFRTMEMTKDVYTLGRSQNCDICITNNELKPKWLSVMSKIHFKITREFIDDNTNDAIVYLEDLSQNGTFVNGKKVGRGNKVILESNDKIALAQPIVIAFESNNLPPELKNKYTVSRKLGSGACGEVKMIFNKVGCKKFALKTIMKLGGTTNGQKYLLNDPEKIMNEVKILKALKHPCIIRMEEIVDTPKAVYIVLELMEGGELFERIKSRGKLSEKHAKLIFYQVVLAVSYLHDCGITHRDLKPENILLASNSDITLAKVSDFGLSKLVDAQTMMKTFCGTPMYVAPEILSTIGRGSYTNQVNKIYVSPGNYGLSLVNKVSLINLNVKNNKEVAEWSKNNKISLVVIGPEEYLANGLADELKNAEINCFGPQKAASKIETDKYWAKEFMDRYQISTARWKGFVNAKEAKKFVMNAQFPALVIKASGLAAGKGVIVTKNKEEACKAIDEILIDKKFGSAGESIVIEELLEGEEVSILAFTDGKTIIPMIPAQDHKRIFNNDIGPNTGGMGAYCPCPLLNKDNYEMVKSNILQKAIDGLKQEQIPFVGVLYAGLMLTKDGPRVLEFNCRFGDPETQVILPLLKSDLFNVMKACCEGSLVESLIVWEKNLFAVGVILASQGYPISSSKGQIITGINDVLHTNFIFHSGTNISSKGELITNGGRVLITVSLAPSLALAAAKATHAAQIISFDGKQFRTDIAHKGIARSILQNGQLTYKSSGVDIETGNSLVSAIKPMSYSTQRLGSMGSIGSFGGLFDIKATGYKDPILVSGTDGVGTKLKIAFECKKHDTIGIDLVAMCVNDILAHGAEPLFFLDYFACSKLNIKIATDVINGISKGCKIAGCSLIGGETAEMPDMYSNEEYDLAGFAVGVVERNNLLPRINDIKEGDIIIGLPSSGLHSNGFSLVRKILKIANKKYADIAPFSENNRTIGDELLEPTKIYVKEVISALRTNFIKAFAHITGGGITENIPRILPKDMGVILDAKKWKIQPIFAWLATVGGINKEEMLKTFNCGIGAILICSEKDKEKVLNQLQIENPKIIGYVTNYKNKQIRINVKNFEEALELRMKQYIPDIISKLSKPLKKVGVLISGSGTNLQSLIDATRDSSQNIGAEIVIVISNKPNIEGIKRAEKAGIKTVIIKHTDYPSRETFDSAMNIELNAVGVEIVCLAGFMRILSDNFVNQWHGALINIHPSLLPSFKGAHAHENVLKAGVRVSGCTVHFVETDIDSGAIIEQAAVPVFPYDTIESLQERVKTAEHRIFPLALKYLATGRIQLKEDNTILWKY